ncbi:MAG: hypothetical protein HWD59_09860 [Coxiellaceae bacterium]|nr:MAG: hypothetical protein HWD59_09860 [Coxiellaceae bacterium]
MSSIIDYLDFGSIANLAGTSKKMHELIYGNSALLKYVLANKFGRPEHFNALSHEHLRIYLQTAIKYFSLVATIKTSSPPKTRFVSIVNIAVQGWHKIMGGKAASNERNQVVERIIFDPALNRSMFDLVTFCVENDLPILLKFIVNSHGKYFMPLLLSFNSFFDNQKDALSYRILEKISVLYLSALRKIQSL